MDAATSAQRLKEERRRKCEVNSDVALYDEGETQPGNTKDKTYRDHNAAKTSKAAQSTSTNVDKGGRNHTQASEAGPSKVGTSDGVQTVSNVAKIRGNPRPPKRCILVGKDGQLVTPTGRKLNPYGKYALVDLAIIPKRCNLKIDDNGFVTIADIVEAALGKLE